MKNCGYLQLKKLTREDHLQLAQKVQTVQVKE